jgi:hypothetical protein
MGDPVGGGLDELTERVRSVRSHSAVGEIFDSPFGEVLLWGTGEYVLPVGTRKAGELATDFRTLVSGEATHDAVDVLGTRGPGGPSAKRSRSR